MRGPHDNTSPDLGCSVDSWVPSSGCHFSGAKKDKKAPVYFLQKEAKPSYEISAANDSWEEKTTEKPQIASSRMGQTHSGYWMNENPGRKPQHHIIEVHEQQEDTLSQVSGRE